MQEWQSLEPNKLRPVIGRDLLVPHTKSDKYQLRTMHSIYPPGNPPNFCSNIGTMTADPCSFVGNADLYGTGTRFGIYCQWLATVIANYKPDEVSAMQTINLSFQ